MLMKALPMLAALLAPTAAFLLYVFLRRLLFGATPPRTTPWFWLAAVGLLFVAAGLGWQWCQGVGETAGDRRYVPAQMAPDGSIIPPTTAPRGE